MIDTPVALFGLAVEAALSYQKSRDEASGRQREARERAGWVAGQRVIERSGDGHQAAVGAASDAQFIGCQRDGGALAGAGGGAVWEPF